MAIGIRIQFAGLSQEEFDEVNKHVDPESNPPEGLLFHASGPIDGGWGVLDFWESSEAWDAFQPRIQSSVEAAGIELQGPPDIKQFPVHEHFPR
jgi:hypothetical protein